MPGHSYILFCGLLPIAASAACQSLVTIDVDCEQLCLDAQGPTIPAMSNQWPSAIGNAVGVWDGGAKEIASLLGSLDGAAADDTLSALTAAWSVEMPFNEVLAQLPSAAAGLSADVRLASVALRSPTELDFLDSVEVTMSHGSPDASSPEPPDGSGNVDGGAGLDCRATGFVMRVAYFQRSASAPSGNTIDLTMVAPDMNLFACMKDEPTRFDVQLSPHLGSVSTVDAPLTLGTCVGAATHFRYP
jgi:hypothetical protein